MCVLQQWRLERMHCPSTQHGMAWWSVHAGAAGLKARRALYMDCHPVGMCLARLACCLLKEHGQQHRQSQPQLVAGLWAPTGGCYCLCLCAVVCSLTAAGRLYFLAGVCDCLFLLAPWTRGSFVLPPQRGVHHHCIRCRRPVCIVLAYPARWHMQAQAGTGLDRLLELLLLLLLSLLCQCHHRPLMLLCCPTVHATSPLAVAFAASCG